MKWPVLLHDPNYDKEQSKCSEIEFEYSSEYQEFGRYAKGGKECTEPPGVRRNLQDKTIYSNPQLMHRISLHLNGYLKRGEPMNALRERAAIEQNGMDWWVDGVNACNDIADAIATKFKEAQKKLS